MNVLKSLRADFLKSLSSRGWSTWCLRRRGESQICLALLFSSVTYKLTRRRRSCLSMPACLTGSWRPFRAIQPLFDCEESHTFSHICYKLFAPSCVIIVSPRWKHNVVRQPEKFIHLTWFGGGGAQIGRISGQRKHVSVQMSFQIRNIVTVSLLNKEMKEPVLQHLISTTVL